MGLSLYTLIIYLGTETESACPLKKKKVQKSKPLSLKHSVSALPDVMF